MEAPLDPSGEEVLQDKSKVVRVCVCGGGGSGGTTRPQWGGGAAGQV